jgi:hypothetical protein
MHLDVSTLDASLHSVDQSDATEFVAGLSSANQTGSGTYQGTVDGTRITVPGEFDDTQANALGGAAKSLSFTAAVDDHDRISDFSVSIPAGGDRAAVAYSVAFSGYGTPVAVSGPSNAVEAPAAAYTLLGG